MWSSNAIMMRKWLSVIFIVGVFFISLPMQAEAALQDGFYQKDGERLSVKDVARRFSTYDVIFFGEYHDNTWIHEQENEFLKALYLSLIHISTESLACPCACAETGDFTFG